MDLRSVLLWARQVHAAAAPFIDFRVRLTCIKSEEIVKGFLFIRRADTWYECEVWAHACDRKRKLKSHLIVACSRVFFILCARHAAICYWNGHFSVSLFISFSFESIRHGVVMQSKRRRWSGKCARNFQIRLTVKELSRTLLWPRRKNRQMNLFKMNTKLFTPDSWKGIDLNGVRSRTSHHVHSPVHRLMLLSFFFPRNHSRFSFRFSLFIGRSALSEKIFQQKKK